VSKKDRERKAAKEAEKEARRHGNETRYACPFPGCGRAFWKEEGKPNACNDHRKLINDVMFIMDHTTTRAKVEEEGDPKIFVPKPGMSNLAIKQAAEVAKGVKP